MDRIASLRSLIADPGDECIEWPFWVHRNGYGGISLSGTKKVLAHRMAWCLTNNVDYDSLGFDQVVAHRCDNRPCVNPAHLFLTDRAGNSADMADKDRSAFGEQHPMAVLDEKAVRMIRDIRATCDYSYREIAEMFGVGRSTVGHIIRGETWTRA